MGCTSTRSRLSLRAISRARGSGITPNCSPACPMRRTSRARIWLLTRRSLGMGWPPRRNTEKQRGIPSTAVLQIYSDFARFVKLVRSFVPRPDHSNRRTSPSALLHRRRDRPLVVGSTPSVGCRRSRRSIGTSNSRSFPQKSRSRPCLSTWLVPTVGLEPTRPKAPGF